MTPGNDLNELWESSEHQNIEKVAHFSRLEFFEAGPRPSEFVRRVLYVLYGADSKCAGKGWPRRLQRLVKLYFPTIWSQHGHF